MLDLRDNGPEKDRRCRYVLVLFDIFSEFGWTIPLKKCSNNKDSFENNFKKNQR